MDFELDPRLARDSVAVAELPLSQLLMMDQAALPWLLLVPRRAGLREIHELTQADRDQLWRESDALARAISAAFAPHKLNIAAIGNVVAQLHVHHVARYSDDPAWPQPVWGRLAAAPMPPALREQRLAALRAALDAHRALLG